MCERKTTKTEQKAGDCNWWRRMHETISRRWCRIISCLSRRVSLVPKPRYQLTQVNAINVATIDLLTFQRGSQKVLVVPLDRELVLYDINSPATNPVPVLGRILLARASTTTSTSVSQDTRTLYMLQNLTLAVADLSNLAAPTVNQDVFSLPAVDASLQGSLVVDNRPGVPSLYVSFSSGWYF